MPWCPNCKEEFKEGIEECPDCKLALVATLEEATRSDYQDLLTFPEEEMAIKFIEYLDYSKIDAQYRKDTEKGNYVISVLPKNITKAKKHFAAFYSVETSQLLEQNLSNPKDGFEENEENSDTQASSITEEDRPLRSAIGELRKPTKEYVSMSEKQNDLLSTLIVFSVFELAGLILFVLELLHVIHFMNTIMLILVGAIIFVGIPAVLISSFRSYKKTIGLAIEEEKLTKALNEWMTAVFTDEAVHKLISSIRINSPQLPEEQVYIILNQAMKKRIMDQFGELDETYLDFLVDQFYDEHFSEDYESLEESDV